MRGEERVKIVSGCKGNSKHQRHCIRSTYAPHCVYATGCVCVGLCVLVCVCVVRVVNVKEKARSVRHRPHKG